ncbi:MAG: DUF4159 domain-containing protein, partial [Acidimicrobiia bacterium]
GSLLVVTLALAAASFLLRPLLPEPAGAQTVTADNRFAGLQWTFARIRYKAAPQEGQYRREYWGEPWAIDAPAAEQNLSRRIRSVTAIEVNEPIVLTIDDPQLWQYPWIYIVEPGFMRLDDNEVSILREFLLRGGFLMFDDFHGPYEWDNLEQEMRRVFPTRKIVDLPLSHPIFSCFYKLDAIPQIPGLGSFFNGRTWEKGGFIPHLRAIYDDSGRVMVLINWNTDMGDGWEWSNAEEYPGYVRYTAEAYRMGINEVIYSLTH